MFLADNADLSERVSSGLAPDNGQSWSRREGKFYDVDTTRITGG